MSVYEKFTHSQKDTLKKLGHKLQSSRATVLAQAVINLHENPIYHDDDQCYTYEYTGNRLYMTMQTPSIKGLERKYDQLNVRHPDKQRELTEECKREIQSYI